MSSEEFAESPTETDSELEDKWMIRPCDVYDDEYSDCRSIKARFHQYFVHGKSIDCSQWKRDSDNCSKWTNKQDVKAAKELIESEKARRMQRLRAHYGNKVWEKRDGPPEDWNKKLPDYLLKEYEYTYLNMKSREMKGDPIPGIISDSSFCTIM